nr:DUF1844 domain-containing protein [Desulfobacterales bacterium]
MEEKKKGFSVKDRRIFSRETEEVKEGRDRGESAKKVSGEDKREDAKVGREERSGIPESENQLPEVNFATFVLSLSSSALMHFGEIPDQTTGKKAKNLALAKHTIDLLGMLEEKTKGNLTEDEDKLLKNILYDLRMRYVREKG